MRQLDLEADLTLVRENSLMKIQSTGDTIVIDSADSLLPILLMKHIRRNLPPTRLRDLGQTLHAVGLTVEFRQAGVVMGKLGFKASSRWLRALGVTHTEIHSIKLVWTVVSNTRVWR